MARSDLLIQLIQSGIKNDKMAFRKVVESIIAEERSKQHNVLAEQLSSLLNIVPSELTASSGNAFFAELRSCNLFYEITPQKKFSDLILPSDTVKICNDVIQEQHRADLLRSYNLEPRNHVLLVGPPGNGKTSLAEAIAEALVVPLLVVRYESIVGAYLGDTASRLKKLFEYAATRKCVLFFDEFETLGKERGDPHETGEIKRVVSSLLLQIDSLPTHVMVIGATNHGELLDRAVWRRFQIRMNLPLPTQAALTEWFEKFERRINTSLDYSPSELAKKLSGSSFAEAEEFAVSAYRQYVLEQPKTNMRKIVAQSLKEWNARSISIKPGEAPNA